MGTSKSEITQLLHELREKEDNSDTYNQLFELVYDELKKIAHSRLQQEYESHTYSKTALVNEVYLKMISQDEIEASNRSHFYAITSRCMRQILIDYARKKKAQKRGGDQKDLTYIDELFKQQQQKAQELIDIDTALKELAELNERLSDVVEMRFFGEMTIEDTAKALGVSESTVKRDWMKARGWLYQNLK